MLLIVIFLFSFSAFSAGNSHQPLLDNHSDLTRSYKSLESTPAFQSIITDNEHKHHPARKKTSHQKKPTIEEARPVEVTAPSTCCSRIITPKVVACGLCIVAGVMIASLAVAFGLIFGLPPSDFAPY